MAVTRHKNPEGWRSSLGYQLEGTVCHGGQGMAVGVGGGWSQLIPSQGVGMERWTLMPHSVSPFYLAQVPAPGMVLPIQDVLSLLSDISLKAPSETCQEVRLLGVCKSSHEEGHHTLHLCFGDSSKSTSFGVIWVSLHPVSTQEPPGSGMHGHLLSPFPLVTEHVWCHKLHARLSFFALVVLPLDPGGLTC